MWLAIIAQVAPLVAASAAIVQARKVRHEAAAVRLAALRLARLVRQLAAANAEIVTLKALLEQLVHAQVLGESDSTKVKR